MEFLQENLYTWETMVGTALYQLGESVQGPPAAMVFEPPGRFGTRRTLPEMNMAYGCQIPVDDPKNLIGIIYGFLRGAARLTDKEWGTSIYGPVDRADASWFLTHAYDLGAQDFFFWDSARLACVPYSECLALTRHLRAHVQAHPYRDLPARSRPPKSPFSCLPATTSVTFTWAEAICGARRTELGACEPPRGQVPHGDGQLLYRNRALYSVGRCLRPLLGYGRTPAGGIPRDRPRQGRWKGGGKGGREDRSAGWSPDPRPAGR